MELSTASLKFFTHNLLYLFIVNLESCLIIVLYLMLFVGKGLASY
jgi:hypothetical protein